jgi:hypothetical protein
MTDIALPNDIQKKLANLPEKVRAVLLDAETSAAIGRIGLGHQLMIDKIGLLAEAITLVILGVAHTKNFAGEIATKLQIDEKLAAQIAAEVNEQIFSKIREELQKLDEAPAGAPVAPEPKPYTPPTKLTTDDRRPTTIAPTPPRADLGNPEGESLGAAPVAPKIDTTPFEQKMKEDEIFRAPAVVSEHEAPLPIALTTNDKQLTTEPLKLPPLPKKEDIKYGGKDPYREPTQ